MNDERLRQAAAKLAEAEKSAAEAIDLLASCGAGEGSEVLGLADELAGDIRELVGARLILAKVLAEGVKG